jgi:hypothetical protein
MADREFKVVYKKIVDLKWLEYNPQDMTRQQFEEVKTSLSSFGVVEPAIVNTFPGRENVIVSGNHRVSAALELAWEDYPCYEVSLDQEKEKELSLRMNRSGQFDQEKLKKFTQEELLGAGFSFPELNAIFDDKPTGDQGAQLEKMELQPYESYDYIVLLFRDQMDWLNACQKFGLKNVDHSLIPEKKKIGLGRVVDGARILPRIKDE